MDLLELVWWQFGLGLRLAFRVVAVYGLLALADYVYQRWQHERSLRMSRNEIQEEGKQQEGNPQIRARVRSLQQERRLRRMMQDVPSASVVVVNPTHIAVAIAYDQRAMRAPRVVAKGKRLLAERIVRLAREAGVPVIQDIPLARTLYKLVEVGGEIPVTLYRAVAKVLAYVFGRASKRGVV
jgi:flagellar biosynthetic protein FlhB